jgi:hypothetical protein
LYLDPPKLLRIGPRSADALAAVSAGLLVYVLHWEPAFGWVEPFLVTALFFVIIRGDWAARLFGLRAHSFRERCAILYHFLFIRNVMPFTLKLLPGFHALWRDSGVQFALMLMAVFGLAAMLYLLVERLFVVMSHEVARALRPDRVEQAARA